MNLALSAGGAGIKLLKLILRSFDVNDDNDYDDDDDDDDDDNN